MATKIPPHPTPPKCNKSVKATPIFSDGQPHKISSFYYCNRYSGVNPDLRNNHRERCFLEYDGLTALNIFVPLLSSEYFLAKTNECFLRQTFYIVVSA